MERSAPHTYPVRCVLDARSSQRQWERGHLPVVLSPELRATGAAPACIHGPERAAQAPGDVLSGASLLGEEDGLEASPDRLLRDGLSQILELLQAMVAFDVQG